MGLEKRVPLSLAKWAGALPVARPRMGACAAWAPISGAICTRPGRWQPPTTFWLRCRGETQLVCGPERYTIRAICGYPHNTVSTRSIAFRSCSRFLGVQSAGRRVCVVLNGVCKSWVWVDHPDRLRDTPAVTARKGPNAARFVVVSWPPSTSSVQMFRGAK